MDTAQQHRWGWRRGRRQLALASLVWSALAAPARTTAVSATTTPTPQQSERRRDESEARRRELAIRAQFLRHFCSYVEWPVERFDGDSTPLFIGVIGRDPFGALLERAFADKAVHDREVRIRRLGPHEKLAPEERDALREYHALVVAEADRLVQGRIIEALAGRGVLLIAHEPGFAASGGHIQTFVKDNKIRFEINQKAFEADEMTCRAALLKLSRRGPRPDPEPGSPRHQPRAETSRGSPRVRGSRR